MPIRFDDKGKFFTEVISKETVEVIIQTPTNLITGRIHVRPGERLRDEINQSEPFLAVTQVVISSLSKEELYRCAFLALNREHIIWLLPVDQLAREADEKREADVE